MGHGSISICIKSYRKVDLLRHLISNIRRHQDQSYEICVAVDPTGAGANLQLLEELSSTDPLFRFALTDSAGFAHVQNASVELATRPWVWLWDDEFIPTSRFNIGLPELRDDFVYSSLVIEPGNRPVSPYLICLDFGRSHGTFDEERLEQFVSSLPGHTEVRFDEVSYPVLLAKRSYMDLGGVDVLFNWAYAGEPDLWYRLALSGHRFVRVMGSVFYHFQGLTIDPVTQGSESVRLAMERDNNRDFIRKWGELFNYRFGGTVSPGVSAWRGQRGYRAVTCFVDIDTYSSRDLYMEIEPYFDRMVFAGRNPQRLNALDCWLPEFKRILKGSSALSDQYFDEKFKVVHIRSSVRAVARRSPTNHPFIFSGDMEEVRRLRAQL